MGLSNKSGRPKELYHKPANEFVATFIGRTNIIPANLEKRSDGAYIVFSDGYALRMTALDQAEEQAIHVSISSKIDAIANSSFNISRFIIW